MDDRCIDVISYSIETILAEKIECVLSRSVANTRMKDYYDCYILSRQHESLIDFETLLAALKNTAATRKTEYIFESTDKNIDLIKNDDAVKRSWLAYSKQFAYANDITFESLVEELEKLLGKIGIL